MAVPITKAWVVAAVVLVPWAAATLCPSGVQYWSNDSEICINCSRCDSATKQVVIRPCQAHADTVCGPISRLNVDWSWLKSVNKHRTKHVDNNDQSFAVEKKYHEKTHRGRAPSLDDDIENTQIYHSELDDEVESFPLISHHSGHKSRKYNQPKEMRDFLSTQNHRSMSLDPMENESPDAQEFKKNRKHGTSPSPPLKSAEEIEKEWRTWLAQSRDRLQHRKDDLLKNLHRESPYNERHQSNHKLNHPSGNAFDDSDGEIFHRSVFNEDHSDTKHFSPLDLEIFHRLLNHEQFKHAEQLDKSKHGNLLDMMESDDRKRGNDLTYPMDSFDFKSAVPTHRLFLGEPSTVSEIMDQDISDDTEDDEDERVSVVAVPFTTAERFVWDWQAVALTSAVAACLLFFVVVTVYSLLHARQWNRFKSSFENDVEDLSAKVGLMSGSCGSVGSSAADGVNTNHYLEDLLENKKMGSNIYTQKRPSS